MKPTFIFVLLILVLCFSSCRNENKEGSILKSSSKELFIPSTDSSKLENQYSGFHSPNAINKIAGIENEYYQNVDKKGRKYYGTEWKKLAELETANDTISIFENYLMEMEFQGLKPDSLHCTMYAMKALEVGLDTNFTKFEKLHKQIYKKHEYAGWSVAYILTKYFNWKAYLVISQSSGEYEACLKNFKKDKSYHVWRQPNIPLEAVLDFDTEEIQIDSLLNQNEFAWGFSYQGWHTWITRFDQLKECNWAGSPLAEYSTMPLFYQTKFTNYYAYNSHIVVFPPKEN